jgi:hypothetical protein
VAAEKGQGAGELPHRLIRNRLLRGIHCPFSAIGANLASWETRGISMTAARLARMMLMPLAVLAAPGIAPGVAWAGEGPSLLAHVNGVRSERMESKALAIADMDVKVKLRGSLAEPRSPCVLLIRPTACSKATSRWPCPRDR